MGKKKKKQDAPSGPKGAPDWVVTFTDMVSLLVTFFVLMMTFSSLREDELLKLPTWLQKFAGFQTVSGNTAVAPEFDQLTAMDLERGKPQPHSRPADELSDDVAEMGQEASEEDQKVDLNDVADGLLLEFGRDECFDPGSTSLPAKLVDSLERVGEVLRHYPHMVVVEGFTDDAFRSSPRYPSPEALSFARAQAAASLLLSRSAMNPALLQIAGHGAKQPRADNVSASGRRLNRRVQLRVLSLSKMRDGYLKAAQAREDG